MNKFKQNIKQSWELLMQNLLLSVVSILTTALTITYLMVLWMGYMLYSSNMSPEDKRERTIHISDVERSFKVIKEFEDYSGSVALEVKLMEQVIAPIKGAELIRAYGNKQTSIFKLPNKERIELVQAITNENVWEQFSYKFIEGRPFTKEEVKSGIDVAVISRSTARKLFHTTENIVGREITPEFPQKTYRVVGIVEDVSAFFSGAFAQIWVPFSNDQQNCMVDILRKKDVSKEDIEAELIENFAKYTQAHPKYTYTYKYFSTDLVIQLSVLFFSLILLIVPVVNGMGLVASSISERTSEIGIRKAYGANRKSLIRQFVYENIFSTGIGAIIGLICSMLIVVYFGKLLLVFSDEIDRELYSLSFSSLFDIRVFALAMLFCFMFNIMSVYIPAMRATRTSIAEAVKGGES